MDWPSAARNPEPEAAGLAGRAARAAAAAGARVEVVGKVGEGPAGDAVLLALARAGAGHVATLRDASHPTPRVRSGDEAGDGLEDAAPVDADETVRPDATADDPDPPTLEAADVTLALRYLTDYRVILVLEPATPGIVTEAAAAAAWAGAHLVIASSAADAADAESLPSDAVVLALDPDEMASGADDGDRGLIPTLGRYAAAVDAGMPRPRRSRR